MNVWLWRAVLRCAAAALVVGAATLVSVGLEANAVTAGFLYLIAVLGVSVWQGFVAGTAASLFATAAFNYFFFAPVHTFRVSDPENWIALASFLVVATIASRLVVRERERAEEADAQRREIAALYELCVDLFAAGARPGGLDAAIGRALRALGAQGGGLILGGSEAGTEQDGAWIGTPQDLEVHRLLRNDTEGPSRRQSHRWRNVRVPVAVGAERIGEFVAYGTRANRQTLESVARLIGLALERERLLAEQARVEALKSSDALKTALLQAVSHDLATPLTAIMVSAEALGRGREQGADPAPEVELIVTEASRLHRRIENLLDMARLEAGAAVAHREPTPPADLFRAAKEHLRVLTKQRSIEAHVAGDCPDLDVDPSLAVEVLINLLENADRASPGTGAIELTADRHPTDPGRVVVEVLDRGRGLGRADDRIGSGRSDAKPATGGDLPRKGLGLEIARRFTAALEGTLSLTPRDGGGVCARLEWPAARAEPLPGRP